jgi:hypothetical protein
LTIRCLFYKRSANIGFKGIFLQYSLDFFLSATHPGIIPTHPRRRGFFLKAS